AMIAPFVKILRIICQKLSPVFVRSHKNTEKKKRSSKKPLKSVWGLLYNKKAKVGRFTQKLVKHINTARR
ncbi:MAG: hypothetical protein K2H23_04680, partial [Oscillospiraceae bacterium]|nr:hypothetical protein [Oscillospiraceae bacterium]